MNWLQNALFAALPPWEKGDCSRRDDDSLQQESAAGMCSLGSPVACWTVAEGPPLAPFFRLWVGTCLDVVRHTETPMHKRPFR